jgi:hypothetical protein
MASHPDPHPDSDLDGPSDSPEQVSPASDPGRESVEGSPGDFVGTIRKGASNSGASS